MADVAKLAGVSQQTVSRVVNGSADVRAETRERVRGGDADARLPARTPRRARWPPAGSRTLGVVRVDTALYGPASTLFGHRARGARRRLPRQRRVASAGSTSTRPLHAVERLRTQGVDGILVIGPRREAARGAAPRARATSPVVTVEGWPDDGVPGVAADHVAGGRAGHRAPARARPPDGLAPRRPGRLDRRPAARARLARRAGRRARDLPARRCRATGARATGYELGGASSSNAAEITAVFSANDQMALGLLRRLHEAGRDVPRDVSVVGFDDLPEAAYLTPPLTTVRWDFVELGRRAVRAAAGRDRAAPARHRA